VKDNLDLKDHLTTSEALRYCKRMGKSISSTMLYYQGLRMGFMSKHPDGYHWWFDRRLLGEYIMQEAVQPPPGWISVGALAVKYKVNLSSVYIRIKKWRLEVMRCDAVKKIYVRESSYLAAVEKNRRIPLS